MTVNDNQDAIEEMFPSHKTFDRLFLRKRNARSKRSPVEILHDFLALAELPIGPTRLFAIHGTSPVIKKRYLKKMLEDGLMKKVPRKDSRGGPGKKYVFISTVKGLELRDKIEKFYEETGMEAFIVTTR